MPASPLTLSSEKLKPPQPKFAVGEGASDDHDNNRTSHHSRTTSGTTSFHESPPITPRSITFSSLTSPLVPLNNHAYYTPDQTPGTSPPALNGHEHSNGFPFPDVSSSSSSSVPRSGATSVSTSVADLTRNSQAFYGRGSYFGTSRPLSARSREAFASPKPRPTTIYSSVQSSLVKMQRERPKSTMITSTSSPEKPWLYTRDPYERLSYFITYACVFLGLGLGGLRCWFGYRDIPVLSGNLCPVLDENFETEDGVFGDNGKFFREVDMSGFGNGEFEMTTASENNSYVRNGKLYITPTFTSDVIGDAAVVDGFVYNITGCTYNITQGISYTSSIQVPLNSSAIGADQPFDIGAYTRACSAVSNATAGTIINPIQSARISTRKTASIRYGRVEVRAKIPTGDWMWPAIWMLPVDNKYGPWPISGEIDIMESRGNGPEYQNQGSNFVRGSLNWGPVTWLNSVWRTFGWWNLRRGSYDQGFHDYVLEWDKDFLRVYVDTRLHKMLDLRFNIPFFKRGDYPNEVQNGAQAVFLDNPWVNGTNAAPFDQPFYLIMNIAVGGTNGWFPDGNGKPWLDGSATAMGDFWRQQNQWLPTWPENVEDRSLVIEHVKMWQQC